MIVIIISVIMVDLILTIAMELLLCQLMLMCMVKQCSFFIVFFLSSLLLDLIQHNTMVR